MPLESLKPAERAYFDAYWRSTHGTVGPPRDLAVRASRAGNAELADSLLALYLSGKKTAGSGLVKDYLQAGDPLPQPEDYWIILDRKETPHCIVKTVRVERYRFDEVPAHVARAEGEGDLSLTFWKTAHTEFFSPFLKSLGIAELASAEVVVEFFEKVFPN